MQVPFKVAWMPKSLRVPESGEASSRMKRVQVVLSIHLPPKLAPRVAAPLGVGWLMTRPGGKPVQLLFASAKL